MAGRNLVQRGCVGVLVFWVSQSVPAAQVDAVSTPRATVDFSRTVQRVEERIPVLMKKHEVKGLSAVLVAGGRVVWCRGFGYADTGKGFPAAPDTLYRLGSASSLLTVAAVLELAAAQRIDLEAPLTRYLPTFTAHNRFGDDGVTVGHLLSHHGGLPADVLRGKWAHRPEPFAALLAHPAARSLVAAPGSLYVQSAVGMNVLGALLEARSGMPFVEYMQAFLARMGLQHSRYLVAGSDPAKLARDYHNSAVQPRFLPRDLPANGLTASANEVARFLSLLLEQGRAGNQQRLPAAVVNALWQVRNQQVQLDMQTPFAYGWALGAFELYGAGPVAHFSGQSLFQQNQIVVVPQHGLAAAVLANSQEARPVVDEVAQLLLAGALSDQAGIIQPATTLPEALQGDEAVTAGRDFVGRYATWRGFSQVYQKGKHLHIRMGERELFLQPHRDGWFSMQYRLFGMIPISIDALKQIRLQPRVLDNRKYMLAKYRGDDFVFGEALQPRPVSARWRTRLGRYRILNPDDALDVKELFLELEDGVLSVSYSAPPFIKDKARFPLRVQSDTQAVVAGLGRHLGQLLWFDSGDVHTPRAGAAGERMHMSGFVAERLGQR